MTALVARAVPTGGLLARLPFGRDQAMLAYLALNFAFLGLDTFLVHYADLTILPREWVPIVFGPAAALALLVAGAIAQRRRLLAATLATFVLTVSIGVGVLGTWFHLLRGIQPFAPPGDRIGLDLLVWAPPVLGPLMFAVVGILGITAAWPETPAGSGRLRLPGGIALQLPYGKTQAYFYVVAMASLLTLISSVLDHARFGLASAWIWPPIAAGIFATTVAAGVGAVREPSRGDRWTYAGAMVALVAVGVVGAWLHYGANLIAGGTIVQERFLRGAPLLAPLLFTNVGVLGLLVLVPEEPDKEREAPR